MPRQQSIGKQMACFASYVNAESTLRGPNDDTQNDQLDIVLVTSQKFRIKQA
jgi:hypothetical protein